MRILLGHNRYVTPGGEDVVFQQERDLLIARGHDVSIYERSNREIGRDRQFSTAIDLFYSRRSNRELAALIAKHRPDVVHFHNTFPLISPSVYFACHDARVPVVQTIHNYRMLCPGGDFFRNGSTCSECSDRNLLAGVKHACYRGSRVHTAAVAGMLAWHRQQDTWSLVDRFIAPSRFLRDRFVAAGWDPAKIVVKPHFVPGLFADEASPTEGRGRFAMYAGRLSPEKGIRTLIAAWALLPREIPLYVFGDGPLRAEMESTVAASGANVKFFGWLSRAELLDYDRRARMLIYPSECFESFALGITEAFACGTPVICSRLGAMEEMVQHGSTGWHFTAGRAEELSRMVRTLWENPPVLDAVGRAALAEFRARFTADRNHDLLLEIYRAAIEKNQGAECLRPDEVAA